MTQIGNKEQLAFDIGRSDGNLHQVSIYLCGKNVTSHDNWAYLPSFLPALKSQSETLKNTFNFLRFESFFEYRYVDEIHTLLFGSDSSFFRDEKEHWYIQNFHRFMNLDEPNTDTFAAFLIPARSKLCLTLQFYETVEIYGVEDVLPFDLAITIDRAVASLKDITE